MFDAKGNIDIIRVKTAQRSLLKAINNMMCEADSGKNWRYIVEKQIKRLDDELRNIKEQV
jgi:uncharacterized protein YaaN involved in tellurite resistance